MTGKERVLYTLMEEMDYSYGLMNTAIAILGQSPEAVEEMIYFIDDNHPTEQEFIERMAEMCE